jgi:hypothetical protein
MHSNIPTINANNIASSVYNSSDELTIPPSTLETSRETNATGPIASCRDDPNMAYTNIGIKPVSTLQNQHNHSRVKKKGGGGIHDGMVK